MKASLSAAEAAYGLKCVHSVDPRRVEWPVPRGQLIRFFLLGPSAGSAPDVSSIEIGLRVRLLQAGGAARGERPDAGRSKPGAPRPRPNAAKHWDLASFPLDDTSCENAVSPGAQGVVPDPREVRRRRRPRCSTQSRREAINPPAFRFAKHGPPPRKDRGSPDLRLGAPGGGGMAASENEIDGVKMVLGPPNLFLFCFT
jgi:hypothetical protein